MIAEVVVPEPQQEDMIDANVIVGLGLPADQLQPLLQQEPEEEQQQPPQGQLLHEEVLAGVPEGWGLAGIQVGALNVDPTGSIAGGEGAFVEGGLQHPDGQQQQLFAEGGPGASAGSVTAAPYLEPPCLGLDWSSSDSSSCSSSSSSAASSNSSTSWNQDNLLRLCFPSSLIPQLLGQGYEYLRVVVGTEGGREILLDQRWGLAALLAKQAEGSGEPVMAGHGGQQQEGEGTIHLELQLDSDLIPVASKPIGWLSVACLVGPSAAAAAEMGGHGGYAEAGFGAMEHGVMELVLSTMSLLLLPTLACEELQQLAARVAAAGLARGEVYHQVLMPVMKDVLFVVSNSRGGGIQGHPTAELLLSQVVASLADYCNEHGLKEFLALVLEAHAWGQGVLAEAGGLGVLGLMHEQQAEQQEVPELQPLQQQQQQRDVVDGQGAYDSSVKKICSKQQKQAEKAIEQEGELEKFLGPLAFCSGRALPASVCYALSEFLPEVQLQHYNRWKSAALKLQDLLVLLACVAYLLLLLLLRLPGSQQVPEQQQEGEEQLLLRWLAALRSTVQPVCMLLGHLLVVLGSQFSVLSGLQQQRGTILLGAASLSLLLTLANVMLPTPRVGVWLLPSEQDSSAGSMVNWVSVLLHPCSLRIGMGPTVLAWVLMRLGSAVAAAAFVLPGGGLQQLLYAPILVAAGRPGNALLEVMATGCIALWLEARLRQRFLITLATYSGEGWRA